MVSHDLFQNTRLTNLEFFAFEEKENVLPKKLDLKMTRDTFFILEAPLGRGGTNPMRHAVD